MRCRAISLMRAALLLGIAGSAAVDAAVAADDIPATGSTTAPEVPEQGLGKLGSAHLPATAAEPLETRLAEQGLKLGSPILIRIFKEEAELEIWMQAGGRFTLVAAYPICNWSGTLGPKRIEGDKQSPEGLYSIGRRQMRYSARWRRSLDIGYPNAFDRANARTGSYVLLHGGCTSTGCFAMTDPVMDDIFRISRAALSNGQARIQVHAFPFRMTTEKMAAHADGEWGGFWANLKEAYDLFEQSRVPPAVSVCGRRYVVSDPGSGVAASACPGGAAAEGAVSTRPRRSAARRRPGRSAIRAYAAARKARLAARARATSRRAQSR